MQAIEPEWVKAAIRQYDDSGNLISRKGAADVVAIADDGLTQVALRNFSGRAAPTVNSRIGGQSGRAQL